VTCTETYQGGGEDGEEDTEAEDDAVAGGLGEDGDASEEAVWGEGGGDGQRAFRENPGWVNRGKRHQSRFSIASRPLRRTAAARRARRWQFSDRDAQVLKHLRCILDANAVDVGEVLGETGGAFGDPGQTVGITGTGHGALNCWSNCVGGGEDTTVSDGDRWEVTGLIWRWGRGPAARGEGGA
jgi:hypothetical protein